jgi:hypothetical protein
MASNFFTEDEILFLKEKYDNTSTSDLAKLMNRPIRSIYGKAHELGLKKSSEFLQSALSGRLQKGNTLGADFTFKKGHIPPNKGKKITEFMDSITQEKFKANMFKPGNTPHNACKDWEERIYTDTNGKKYIKIKVPGINKMVFKHIWLYTKTYGEIPKGNVVAFMDGNSLNCVAENLRTIPMAENMLRNSIQRFPEELKSVIRLLSKLNKKIEQNEKQN